jgi:hypothetical protein
MVDGINKAQILAFACREQGSKLYEEKKSVKLITECGDFNFKDC